MGLPDLMIDTIREAQDDRSTFIEQEDELKLSVRASKIEN
jgi:hypothetical protein